MAHSIKILWEDSLRLGDCILRTIASTIPVNKQDHSIAIAQSLTDENDLLLCESLVSVPLESFKAISQALIGTAIGINSGDAIRYRSSKDQLFQRMQEHKDVLAEIIVSEEYTAQVLCTDTAVNFVQQLATLVYTELYDRNLASKTEEE